MNKLTILNKKEQKKILKNLAELFGFDRTLDYVFLENNQEKVYLAKKDIFDLDLSKLRVDLLGCYFGQHMHGEFRLSIEGSQLIGPHCKHHIVDLSPAETKAWMAGEVLPDTHGKEGFVLIRDKTKKDFLGCGKAVERGILNYYPKIRRVTAT